MKDATCGRDILNSLEMFKTKYFQVKRIIIHFQDYYLVQIALGVVIIEYLLQLNYQLDVLK